MAPAMLALLRLTETFAQGYAAEKLRRNATDFSDQEHFALALLMDETGTPTELGRAVSARYREIMIDEFEHTNEVQNQDFCGLYPGRKRICSWWGDMKQSIYRFRLADPTIFLRHYQADPLFSQAKEGQERKLLLSRNFRSRREILDAANFVCANLMSPEERGNGLHGRRGPAFRSGSTMESAPAATHWNSIWWTIPKKMRKPRQKKRSNALKRKRALWPAAFGALLDEPFLVQDGRRAGCALCGRRTSSYLLRSPGARQKLDQRVLSEQGIARSAEGGEGFLLRPWSVSLWCMPCCSSSTTRTRMCR